MTKSRKKESEFYFDDCPICQAMKKADEEGKDLNKTELLEAFKEASKVSKYVKF